MIFAALAEAASKDELLLVNGGMCRFHRRRDGVVVIREILVLPQSRLMGVGSDMVAEVQRRNPGCVIHARCPAEYEANGFWERIGCSVIGRSEKGNLWELLA